LDTDPTPEDHHTNFERIFAKMEDTIFKNNKLSFFLHDLPELFYSDQKIRVSHLASLNLTQMASDMQVAVTQNPEYQEDADMIFTQIAKDIKNMTEYLEMYSDVQEIHDFYESWKQGKTTRMLSLDMGFYNKTFEKIQVFNNIISRLPNSNTKVGTILLETVTLKKKLTEIPIEIMDSIRNKVT
jgi:hypothetical protein